MQLLLCALEVAGLECVGVGTGGGVRVQVHRQAGGYRSCCWPAQVHLGHLCICVPCMYGWNCPGCRAASSSRSGCNWPFASCDTPRVQHAASRMCCSRYELWGKQLGRTERLHD